MVLKQPRNFRNMVEGVLAAILVTPNLRQNHQCPSQAPSFASFCVALGKSCDFKEAEYLI